MLICQILSCIWGQFQFFFHLVIYLIYKFPYLSIFIQLLLHVSNEREHFFFTFNRVFYMFLCVSTNHSIFHIFVHKCLKHGNQWGHVSVLIIRYYVLEDPKSRPCE